MIRPIKKLLISNFDKFLSIRHFLKLYFFKSPMQENFSLRFLYKTLEAKFVFFKEREKNILYKVNSREFNNNGFTIFSNDCIEFNCNKVLNRIKSLDNPWDLENEFKYGPPSDIFKKEFINIFNNGIDEFIKNTFKSDYYIFYHKLYKSDRHNNIKEPEGSELWHADGGPGSCMNLMICHTPINKSNGSMKIIPWGESIFLLTRLFLDYKRLTRSFDIKGRDNRMTLRSKKCLLLKKYIESNKIKYFQPESVQPGTIFAFRNNCVHAGGYTNIGCERIVSVMHIYPSKRITSLEEKFKDSHLKVSGYPM